MVKRRVLVTGGAGFLGSALVRELCAAGTSVVVLDDLSTGRAVDLAPEAELLVGDVADPAILRKAAGGCEVLFHLAAARAVPRSIEEPLETDTANVHGTLAALVAAREAGVRRVVLASSSSVYGQPAVVPTPESAPLAPASPYGVSKLAGEHYGRVFGELHGLEVVALRYFNLYGPGQRADLVHATLVPRLLAALRGGGRPELHGDGCQRRDFTYVSDAVDATVAAASAPADVVAGRAYNVAAGRSHSVRCVLEALRCLVGRGGPTAYRAARPGDVQQTGADLRSARTDLGYRPHIPLGLGLALTAAWHEVLDPAEDAAAYPASPSLCQPGGGFLVEDDGHPRVELQG